MSRTRVLSWPVFLFWSAAAVGSTVAIALHPTEVRWWGLLVVSLGGVALYLPFHPTARVRRSIIVDRPIEDVYRFLSQPSNRHIWNSRVGRTQPSDVPVEVGQEWTFAPTNRGQKWARLRHAFSKLEPPNRIEITATGHGMHITYAFVLHDRGSQTEVVFEGAVPGIAAPAAWLSSWLVRLYQDRDLARLKHALEHEPSSA
jgi:uncharacterized protein YndB with AHSA1/START domain